MNNTNLIGINGYIGSGKDTIASIIQYLTTEKLQKFYTIEQWLEDKNNWGNDNDLNWQVKKFAGKLKQIASIITGIPVKKFEDQEFKKTLLGEEWIRYGYADGFYDFYKDGKSHKMMNNKQCSKEKYEEEFRINWQTAYKYEYTVRDLLQLLGTECLREKLHENVWINALFADYKRINNNLLLKGIGHQSLEGDIYPNWIISDLRFPNEFEAIKKRGGICIRVNRLNIMTNIKEKHISETALDNYNFDYVLDNNSNIEDLVEKVRVMLLTYKII